MVARFQRKILWQTLLALALPACGSRALFLAGGTPADEAPADKQSPASQSDNANSPAAGSDGRPTEGSEGIPGYLTDPTGLSFTLDASKGNLGIAGKAGEVGSDVGPVVNVVVSIYGVDPSVLSRADDPTVSSLSLPGTLLGSTSPAGDGSFAVTVPLGASVPKVIVLSTTPAPGPGSFEVTNTPANKLDTAYAELFSLGAGAAGLQKQNLPLYPALPAIPGSLALTGTWTPMSVVGAPQNFSTPTAQWSGGRFVIAGGGDPQGKVGRYDPATDTWSTSSAPPNFQGNSQSTLLGSTIVYAVNYADSTSDFYNPAADTWKLSAISPPTTLTGRGNIGIAASSNQVLMWGGSDAGGVLNSGALYDQTANTWTETSTSGAPAARMVPATAWVGGSFLVWGGAGKTAFGDGALFNPATNTWTAMNATGAPPAIITPRAVWTGAEVLVFGIADSGALAGGKYDPAHDAWTPMSPPTAAGLSHTTTDWGPSLFWTGAQLLAVDVQVNSDYVIVMAYDPAADTWRYDRLVTHGAANANLTTAAWTGSELIIFGTTISGNLNVGAVYKPAL